MSMDDYLLGTAILGADFGIQSGPFVTIHVRDSKALVKAKGGALGDLASRVAPQTIENKVYSDMRDKIEQAMKAEGVDAEVKIVSAMGPGGVSKSDFTVGAVSGLALVGFGYAAVKLFKHFIGRR